VSWQAWAACALLILVPLQHPSSLDASAVADAVRIGRSSPPDLDRFRASYRVSVDDPVIRSLEVVTPFRRLVELTEERVRLRDTAWDEPRAAVAARDFDGRLDLVLQLQFSPSNTYRAVPRYSLIVYPRGGGAAILPLDTRSAARYLSGQPAPPGTPILAAIVTSAFDQGRIDTASPVLVAILLDDREVRRVAVDLSGLR
jgi:hypothetical protein